MGTHISLLLKKYHQPMTSSESSHRVRRYIEYNGSDVPLAQQKITTVFDSKPTKSVGHFEENKFSVGSHQFLLDCYPKLSKNNNFGQNAINERQFKNKNERYCAVRLLIFKVAETFCQFPVRDCWYFLP